MSLSVVDRCLKCLCLCCCYCRAVRKWTPADGGPDTKTQSLPNANKAKAYSLERFDRNEMLIFAQSSPQGRLFVEQRVDLLARSFGRLRFEVAAHIDLGSEEIENCLEDFFSRDWTGVGAVCVAVVGGAAAAGYLPARAQHLHESRVLRWLTDQLPAALAGRPRIYITEVERSGVAADSRVYSLPITRSFPDVIGVHIPVIIKGEPNPLQMLCSRLGSERNFVEEVKAAAQEAKTAFPALAHRPIQVDSTLSPEIELVKTTEESTASMLSQSPPDGANRASENFPVGDNHPSVTLPDVSKITLQNTPDSTSSITESLPKKEGLSSGANDIAEGRVNEVDGTTQSLMKKARAEAESSSDGTNVKISEGSDGITDGNGASETVHCGGDGAMELSDGMNEDLEALCEGVNATIDSLYHGANEAQNLPDGGIETAAQAS